MPRRRHAGALAPKAPGVVPVTSAVVGVADVPVRLSAKGTVSAVQSVEVRRQAAALERQDPRLGQAASRLNGHRRPKRSLPGQ